MSLVSLAPVLTPHGRLIAERGEDAPALDAELAQRIPACSVRPRNLQVLPSAWPRCRTIPTSPCES
jgi:hypothetical protein